MVWSNFAKIKSFIQKVQQFVHLNLFKKIISKITHRNMIPENKELECTNANIGFLAMVFLSTLINTTIKESNFENFISTIYETSSLARNLIG